ncbi:MAG: sulfotransferase [Candidatus Sulfotelmatobacter sp.]
MPAELSTTEANRKTGDGEEPTSRKTAPVFVLGCGRSGTKLLYHMLLSSGGFAVYHSESNAFNLLGSRFGNLHHRANRQKLLNVWFRSMLFERSGLTREEIEPRVLNECRNTGDFLRILMETIARKQGKGRWAESTPLHMLYLPTVKKLIPDALIIHIIRDGRDVAVSLNKIKWIRPFFWDRQRSLIVAGIFWKWIVGKGRKYGREMGSDYLEVHYEDLVNKPRETLTQVSRFIDQELDYERIQGQALGSVQSPNSSFRSDTAQRDLSPVGRWRKLVPPAELAQLESVLGDLLEQVGYQCESSPKQRTPTFAVRLMRILYPAFWDLKLWLKSSTPLAMIADIQRMGVREGLREGQ